MIAVPEVREPSPQYLATEPPALVRQFDLLATAPDGVTRLRELILTLAVQGKLVQQVHSDEPADQLLARALAAHRELFSSGRISRTIAAEPISDDVARYPLPTSWVWCRLCDLAWPQAGFAFKSTGFNEVGQGLPLVRIRDVGSELAPSTFFSGEYREEFLVENGEWLVSMDGEFRVRRWHSTTALLNQRVTRLVFASVEVHADFVAIALQRELTSLQGTKAYTTVDHLSGKQIAEAVIPLPPAAEQARIVARVDELMRLCDALEAKGRLEAEQHARLLSTLLGTLTDSTTPEELAANWQRVAEHFDLLLDRPEAVDALEETLLQLGLRGALMSVRDLGDPPAIQKQGDSSHSEPFSWPTVRLGDLLEDLRYGTSAKCSYSGVGTPVLRIPNLRDGGIDVTDLKYGELDAREAEGLRLEEGDLLIIRSNGSANLVGTAALVSAELRGFAFAGYLVRARVDKTRVVPRFMSLVLKTPEIRRQIEAPIRTTSGVKNINSTEIARLSFTLPPLDLQDSIVLRVTELRRLCADLRQRLTASQTTQSHLAEALVAEVAWASPQR